MPSCDAGRVCFERCFELCAFASTSFKYILPLNMFYVAYGIFKLHVCYWTERAALPGSIAENTFTSINKCFFPKPPDDVLICLVLATNQRETQFVVIKEQINQKYSHLRS